MYFCNDIVGSIKKSLCGSRYWVLNDSFILQIIPNLIVFKKVIVADLILSENIQAKMLYYHLKYLNVFSAYIIIHTQYLCINMSYRMRNVLICVDYYICIFI